MSIAQNSRSSKLSLEIKIYESAGLHEQFETLQLCTSSEHPVLIAAQFTRFQKHPSVFGLRSGVILGALGGIR